MALHKCGCLAVIASFVFLNSVQCKPNEPISEEQTSGNRSAKSLLSSIAGNDYFSGSDLSLVRSVVSDCLNQDFTLCLKLKAVNVLNRALVKDDIDVAQGVRLRRNVAVDVSQFNPAVIESARGLDSSQKEQQVDQMIKKQVTTLFQSRSLESEESIPPEEGRGGKKKKKKQLGQMLATAALTAAIILGPIFIKSIALIAGKALLISKIAIVIAGTIALKKLATQPAHHETETVSHHYGRALDSADPHQLAYVGQETQPFSHS